MKGRKGSVPSNTDTMQRGVPCGGLRKDSETHGAPVRNMASVMWFRRA